MRRDMVPRRVVLPLPLAPKIAVRLPLGMFADTWFRMVFSQPSSFPDQSQAFAAAGDDHGGSFELSTLTERLWA